jgi:hypothetical protein
MRVGPYPPLARIPRTLNHVCGSLSFFFFWTRGICGGGRGGRPWGPSRIPAARAAENGENDRGPVPAGFTAWPGERV